MIAVIPATREQKLAAARAAVDHDDRVVILISRELVAFLIEEIGRLEAEASQTPG